jgi:hypothetical protein
MIYSDWVIGLQCHTAPFSWKLVFECDHRLFEITMSACSPKEELEWRSRLADHSSRDILDAGEQGLFTSLTLAIKPLGTVFGKPGECAFPFGDHDEEADLFRYHCQKDLHS